MRDEAPRTATILLVTPDRPSQQRLDMLAADGFEYLAADTPDAALRLLQDHFIEVVLCPTDDTMPEGTGLLRDVAARWPDTIRIGVTDAPDAPDIPDDLFQVIPPDLDPRALSRIVRSATQLFNARRDTDRMALEMRFMTQKRGAPVPLPNRAADEGMGFEALLRGPQSPLNATIATARQLASFDVPILISGETGTGKSRLARAIHDSSLRSDKPFFALNCSGLTDEQIKAELLGIRMNGAGRIGLIQKTGRGTLYLGGLDTLRADTQLWLSRMLTEEAVMLPGHPDPQRLTLRLIAGCRADPRPAVATGLFSADLYHACALGLLSLPALSERREDIPALAQHLLFEAATRHGKTVRGFNNEALAFLTRYDWPGNLRELENEVTRMLIFSQDRILGPDLISRHILQATSGPHDADADAVLVGDGPLKARVEEIEKRILREVLTRLKWNKTRAAEELGLSRVGLRAKLDRYGLAPGCVPVLEGEV